MIDPASALGLSEILLALLVALPLAWAVLAFALGPGRSGWVAVPGLALQLSIALQLAATAIDTGTAIHHQVGGWGAPLGIDLRGDGLALAMVLLTQVVALPLALYARLFYLGRGEEEAYFWPLTGLLVAGLNGLFLSADLFNIYVTLELVGLAAVGLVAAGGKAPQLSAAINYLFATLLGSMAYLLGVALIHGAYGTVSIATLTPLVTAQAPLAVWLAGLLMLVGLMIKTALFPFHGWLPPAHGGAPAPVSALLSALVIKGTFYLVLRLWTGPFAAIAPVVEWLPAALGSGAILWGSWRALRATRIKMLIAYSTVAQLGYLFLIFPLLEGAGAIEAGVMQAWAHGLAKAGMFAAAGVLIRATGQDLIGGPAGVVGRMPITLFAFGLAGVSLMGLPPSSGFLAKWLLIEAALIQEQWHLVAVVLSGGLLAALYVFKVIRQAFLAPPEDVHLAPVPRNLEWLALALSAASILLGLRGVELMALLATGEVG
jgi:formate hydrogenlyase subunit 3/multisubunit Na+/H+ antiporter MnhD subunit